MSSKVAYKESLLPSAVVEAAPAKKGCSAGLRVVKALLLGISAWACLNALDLVPAPASVADALIPSTYSVEAQCPQVSAVFPEKNAELWKSLGESYSSDAFKGRAIEWLGGAVRVP